MDKRYQVFVSSTYSDLQEERREVIKALLELDCIPAGMEMFPASDEEKWDLIKRVIDDCDYYVVILGGRYGSVDATGLSYTEKEYDYAVSRKIPVLGFVHAAPDKLAVERSDIESALRARLDSFRTKVEQRMCQKYVTPDELGGKVSRSLFQAIKRLPAEGWVRGSFAAGPDELAKMLALRGRIDELERQLEEAQTSAPPGTEGLKQGTDTVNLVVHCTYSLRVSDMVVEVTWDDVFHELGPEMMDEASESRLRKRFGEESIWYIDEEKRTSLSVWHRVLNQDSLNLVKVQLAALGLIRKSPRKKAIRDTETYWTLTDYGETYLLRLRALQRSETEDSAVSNERNASESDSAESTP